MLRLNQMGLADDAARCPVDRRRFGCFLLVRFSGTVWRGRVGWVGVRPEPRAVLALTHRDDSCLVDEILEIRAGVLWSCLCKLRQVHVSCKRFTLKVYLQDLLPSGNVRNINNDSLSQTAYDSLVDVEWSVGRCNNDRIIATARGNAVIRK